MFITAPQNRDNSFKLSRSLDFTTSLCNVFENELSLINPKLRAGVALGNEKQDNLRIGVILGKSVNHDGSNGLVANASELNSSDPTGA